MNYLLVAPIVIVRADQPMFTYHSETEVAVGSIVRVGVGKKIVTGVVFDKVASQPSFATKPIEEILENDPLPLPLLKTALWLSEYYATHLAIVLQTILPAGLLKKRRIQQKTIIYSRRDRTNIVLNSEQKSALKTLLSSKNGTFVLHGVTGSGKTQLYIEAATASYKKGESCIVLVPEIALTPQLVAEFANHFDNLVVTHSNMTEAERHLIWKQALESKEPMIVIGPRSALFVPVQKVGLIVVDECHEPSFKQEQSPRYSALRTASVLARNHGAKLILGSATPSIADYYVAESTKSPILTLLKPAIPHAHLPELTLVDQKNKNNFTKHRFISNALIAQTEEALQKGEQVLLFHNRRGTAPSTLCEKCGWSALCDNCFIPLTLHADKHRLLCHICGLQQRVPTVCPVCKHPDVIFKGIGTKMIEQEMAKLFPKAIIARFDADNATEDTIQANYQRVYDGEIDILIGTQLLAKGFDLPKLSVVGIVQADSGLMIPDFQSEERVFQLIYQVAGRVGRQAHASHVVVQTFSPKHPAIQYALARDYHGFYEEQLATRRRTNFPPFVYLLKLTCSYATEAAAIKNGRLLAEKLRKTYASDGLQILGPTPSFHERLGGKYRWQITIKSKQRAKLLDVIKHVPPKNWQFDIDPANLL